MQMNKKIHEIFAPFATPLKKNPSVHLKRISFQPFSHYDWSMIPKRSKSKIQISSLYGLDFIQPIWLNNYHCQYLVSAFITGGTVESLKGLSDEPPEKYFVLYCKNVF